MTTSVLTKTDMQPAADETTENTRDLVNALRGRVRGDVRFDGYTRMLYSTDASLYQIQPVGVVIPKRAEDVQATVEIAARYGVPVLPRGGGSSLAGQTVGAAIVIDFSKYMNDVINVDPAAKLTTVQPGINFAKLNAQVAHHGLMIGPDPASANRATIGGSIGNNATGSHSILYGMMADNVRDVRVVLSDASTAHFGPIDPNQLAALGKSDSLEGRIYAELPKIVHGVTEQILERWPKHWRRASGYNLDRLAAALLPPNERSKLSFDSRFRPPVADPMLIDKFNLAQIITGSEGTLGVMTEATVTLTKRPKMTGLAAVHFDKLIDSCVAIVDILETNPSASELLDKQVMDLARAQRIWAEKLHFVDGDPEAILLTEYYGETEEEVSKKLDHLIDTLRKRGWKGTIRKVLKKSEQADIWEVRKAGLNLLMSRRGDYKPVAGIEDVSVPQEKLADYLGDILDFCGKQDDIPNVAVYAHASAGCLHVRPLLNVKSARGVELLEAVGQHAANLAVKYGGAMSGEHGAGLARSALNPTIFGADLYTALQEVKRAFDPNNLMNPGKVVDAPPVTESLRMGPTYQTIELQTVFDWGQDGGYAPAIEMCNGAGVCRKLNSGTMCPSFMATREEKDSTRGRANALRNALAGRIPQDELFSPEMYDVMDLCLGCKACKTECPSAVDMAKIKAEYLVHYYREHGLPLFNRMMGLLPTINEMLYKTAAPLIPLVNAGMNSGLGKAFTKRMGIHPNRSLPAYAKETFEKWFLKNPSYQKANAPHGTVILFHDTWANYNEPHIAQAITKVLSAAGYHVQLASGRKCCGRPLITGGQADQARPWIDHNVALLAPLAEQGIPIVGIEPSCILTLRDEYLNLASDTEQAKKLAAGTFTFEEFVVNESESGRFTPAWKPNAGKALLHGHCHHKAMVGNDSTVAALAIAGYQVEVIQSGCCGMAGDFGFTEDHYEVSRTIGEERLFPAVRAADAQTVIVASGTSCRHQIGDFTERHPIHLAEALGLAVEE